MRLVKRGLATITSVLAPSREREEDREGIPRGGTRRRERDGEV
jgi:hypothetical protein